MIKTIWMNKLLLKRMGIAALILAIIAVAVWGLKASIALAAKSEEDKVILDEQVQQQPLVLPEVINTESLLADIRVFITSDQVPSENELNEMQAAAIMVSEIQRIFGADLNGTILEISYRDHSGLSEPNPPEWFLHVYIVDGKKYQDEETIAEIIDKMDGEYKAGREPIATSYICTMNALTGQTTYFLKIDPEKGTQPMTKGFSPEEKQQVEQLYRDYAQELFPSLTITSAKFVFGGGYFEDGSIFEQCIITLSDGSGFLFEGWDFVHVKFFPKGVPDDAIGH